MGDRAGRHRARVLMGIRERKLMPDTYVITLPQRGFPDFRRGRGIWGSM